MAANYHRLNDGWFPLLLAVEEQNIDFIQLLLADGADADRAVVAGSAPQGVQDHDWIGTRPLLWAAFRGHAHVVEALLERANIDLGHAGWGDTATYLSAENGHLDVLRLLAARGADLNLLANDGWSPTCIAAARGHVEVVRFLLENDAAGQLNQSGDDGATPTFMAADNGRLDVLRLLMDKGADVNKVDNDEESPAFRAAMMGHHKVLRVLVDNNADINRADKKGQSPAYMAACFGHHEALRVLVDNNADINRADDGGRTPAFTAVRSGHHEVLRVLHRAKARLNEPSVDGWSPMHSAAYYDHLDIVYYLARHGADLAHLDNEGTSAVDLARFEGKIATLLEAVQSAGGWRKYVARLRLPYCLIRHEVSRTGIVCPVNEDEMGQQGLFHFVFGARDEVVEQGPAALLRAAPDDVFAVIGSFLGVRLVDEDPFTPAVPASGSSLAGAVSPEEEEL